MEYDDAEFTDKDCQLADKHGYPSNTERHQRGLPRFDLGEHIDVQLGFESLEESVLLQDRSQRVEAWDSHFSREENGVLGLEAVSQNIEFSSTATETCTISRHINVWSEATSSESVQMLLNSVGEDEGNLVEGSDTQELLPSNVASALDVQCERSITIGKEVLKNSAMDDNQETPTSSDPTPDYSLKQNISASKPKDEGCIPNKEDAFKNLQMLYSEIGQQSAITKSSQQAHDDFGQTELQGASNSLLEGCNTEKTGKHAIEVTQKDKLMPDMQGPTAIVKDETRSDVTEKDATLKDTLEANFQGESGSLVGKPTENNSVQCPTQKSRESVVLSEEQGTSRSLPPLDKTTGDPTDSFYADVTLVDPLLGRNNEAGYNADSKTVYEHDVGRIQEILDPLKVESNQDNIEKHAARVSHDNVVLPDVLLEEGNQQQGEWNLVIESSNKDALLSCNVEDSKFDSEKGIPSNDKLSPETSCLLQEKANDKSILVGDDASVRMQIRSGPSQDGDRKAEEHADVKSSHELNFPKMEEISDPMEVDSLCYQTEGSVIAVSHDSVVFSEMQRNQDMILQKYNEHGGGQHVTEASSKNVLPVIDDEKFKQGEHGMPGSDEQSQETSTLLEEKAKKNKCNSLNAEETAIMLAREHDHNETSLVVANPFSSEDDQNHNVLPIPEEKLFNDDTGNSAGAAAEKYLLEANSFSVHNRSVNMHEYGNQESYIPERFYISSSEVGKNREKESKNTSVESVLSGREIETTDEAIDFQERNFIAPVLHSDIEMDKHTKTVSIQEPKELTLTTEQTMYKCCLQMHDMDVKTDMYPTKQTEQLNQEFEKVVKEASMLHDFKAQDGRNKEIELEANCCSTQNETAIVQECGVSSLEVGQKQENINKNKSTESVVTAMEKVALEKVTASPEPKELPLFSCTGAETVEYNSAAMLVQDTKGASLPVEQAMTKTCEEAVQMTDVYATPESETVVTAMENETVEEVTASPEPKVMPFFLCTGAETRECNSGAVLVQDVKEATLSPEQAMTSACLESVQMTDSCGTPKGVKKVHMPFESKVLDDGDTLLSSDEQQCMPIPGSGNSSKQKLPEVSSSDISEREDFEKAEKDEQPLKETQEYEKDKDTPEAMEVSLEVGISLEPDNDSPTRDGDGNILQAKASEEIIDIASPGKWLSDSKDGCNKVDRLRHTTGDIEGLPVSKTDDTFKFNVGTKNALSGGDLVASIDFPTSGQMDKGDGCWQSFQANQSCEDAPIVCQLGEVQAEASQENAKDGRNSAVSATDAIVQGTNVGLSEVKAKTVPSGEEISQPCSIKELEKKPMSHHQLSVDGQVPSLSIANSTRLTSSSSLQTSTLPDLNATVAPASVLFQQPFSDSQQVQLRAQILVYGSLIQGSLPEEALMLTAFADIGGASQNDTPSDGGRSLWENAWHTAADRIHRKTFSNTSEAVINASGSGTPVTGSSKIVEGMKTPSPIVNVTDSRNSPVPGLRSADLAASRSHSLQTRVTGASNIGRAGSKNTPSVIMNPPRPVNLSSPLWGMSNPVNDGMQVSNIPRSSHVDLHQMAAARHIYQSPQLGHYPSPGNNNPWLSPLHFPGAWLTPPQGTLPESGLPFSSFLVPEITQETLNNRRTPVSSPAPHTTMTHFPSMAVTSIGLVTNANNDALKGIVGVGKQSSSEQKSRKRKKKSVSEEIAPTGGLKLSGAKVKSVASVSKRPPSSTPVSSQGPPMTVATSSDALFAPGTSTPNMLPVSNYQIISRGETGQRVIFSEETASRIEQAKLSAEEAASAAASAVRHSQDIWSQLAAQKRSGLVSECEAKLASAAVAAAAAASVSMAAAAAARVASDAAVQAKLMATEALNSDGRPDTSHYTEVRLLEGKQGHSRSIIAAARETAKKRVEAASAATKRAENLDAVVRAAELAAQAVAQAGAVVAMGDPVPLTLSALLEAGPETYWKLVTEQAGTQKDDKVHGENSSHDIVPAFAAKNIKHLKSKNKRDALKNETVRNLDGVKGSSTEMLKLVEKGCKLIPAVAPLDNVSTEKNNIAQKENQVAGQTSELSEVEAVSREATAASEAEHITETYKKAPAPKANEIKEGSFVEVVSDEEGLRGVWFAAKVLSLKDGKALVLYDELLSDEGPGQLQEWIPLEGENAKPPRIRKAHPMTVMKFEGTRKRRRAAMGSYVWSVGDHVDAWIRDGWWEGIITEKKDDDESKLTVHFPGEGDTSIIKVYNLRPSLIWKDGQWVEWTYLKAGKEGTHEDELPSEKRQKLDKQDIEGQTKGKEKLQKIPNLEEAKKMQELNALMASGKDKSLAVMKNSTFDGSSSGIRVNQLGLQKEGSKVVFGVPKPTKKRKFMDVSKHYVADKMIRNSPDVKYSGKFDKHKAPVSQSHIGLKATNKADDKKFKRPAISKPKDFKFGRGQEGQSKTKSEKEKNSAVNPTVTKEILGQELGPSAMLSSGIDGSKGGRRAGLGGNAPSTKSGEALNPSISKEAVTNRPSPCLPSNGVKAPSATESEQESKGKQSSASDNMMLNIEKTAIRQEIIKDKVSEKATTDTMEPRRSNRRIQPTSRLLEGLQTSPIILKSSYMSFSHEKGGKAQSKLSSSIPKGNING